MIFALINFLLATSKVDSSTSENPVFNSGDNVRYIHTTSGTFVDIKDLPYNKGRDNKTKK